MVPATVPTKTLAPMPGRLRSTPKAAGLPDLAERVGRLAGLSLKFKANSEGHVVAYSQILGWTGVEVTIDPDEVLAGKYGKRLELDMRIPESTRLSGDIRYHDFPVIIPPLDIGGNPLANAFGRLKLIVTNPNNLHIQGDFRNSGRGLPFQAQVVSRKEGKGIYELQISQVRLDGGWPIPAFLAALGTWFNLAVLGGTKGVTLSGFGRIRIDIGQMLKAQ